MDASYKIQRGIHVHLIQFFMCPEFWVHITLPFLSLRFFQGMVPLIKVEQMLQKDDGCDRMAVAENLFDGWRECRYAEI